jgi:AP-3 complex subunit beta
MLAKLPELGLRTQTTASRNIPQADKDLLAINISKQPVIALLTSPNEDEKLKGLKLLAAMYFSRRKVTEFLPYVVNIISNDLRIKRFVYFYLSNVCDSGRTEVLMSINSFHKDLTDNKPLARASALRAFSSLQLEEILPILMVSVQRAVADFSIYVRKAAALTLVKLYEWEDCDSNTLIELLTRLLTDACPVVLGAAVHALSQIAPERLDLMHSHFRRICREIDSFEGMYLPSVLNILERYARTYLDKKVVQHDAEVDVDLKLLIEATMNMLSLDSPAVVMAAAEIIYHFAPEIRHPKAINALLEYRGVRNEIGYLMLTLLYEFARKNSSHFQSISSYFYLNQTESV